MNSGPVSASSLISAAIADSALPAVVSIEEVMLQAQQGMDVGQPVRAWPLLQRLLDPAGPVQAQVLAARLLGHLGAQRRSDALVYRLQRRHPQHVLLRIHWLRNVAGSKGLFRAWQLWHATPLPASAPQRERAEWLALGGVVLAELRDFSGAAAALAEAQTLGADMPWIWHESSRALEYEDRYAEAMEAARHALQLQPDYRAGVQRLAHLYSLVGRDEEALLLLQQAAQRMQSPALCFQLAGFLHEHQRYAESEAMLEQGRSHALLAEKHLLTWLDARRVECMLATGRLQEAALLCRTLDDPYHRQVLERIGQADAAARRVLLDVGFVRQHHMTCAPATLSALSAYWGKQAEHLDVAEQICYDGTPQASERVWAESNGFIASEFTVDWHTATRLLDAGIPFTLVTAATSSAHLQAVIGYDALRRTLLIRDPFQRIHSEFVAEDLFQWQRASGPRGMLLLPQQEAARLHGIDLPDAANWDRYYRARLALQRHDRAAAACEVEQQLAAAPAHALSQRCRRMLALYDGDQTAALAATEALLALYADDTGLMLEKAWSLGMVGTAEQNLLWLQGAVERNPWNAALLSHLALQMLDDTRQLRQAQRHVLRALRVNSNDAGAWRTYAHTLWAQGEQAAALACYRVAAGLGEKSETFALSYFNAANSMGRTVQALAFLEERVQRLGRQSADPLMSCFGELESLEQTARGFVMLEEGLRLRPQDAELRLFAVIKYLRYGEVHTARTLLQATEAPTREAERLRVGCLLSLHEGRLEEAWQQISSACEREPLNLTLQRQAADVLAQRSGQAAAVEHLRTACARHACYMGLHELLLEWLPHDALAEREGVIRHLLAQNPQNPHLQRELAINLGRQQRLEEAWPVAATAIALAPRHSNGYGTRGFLHLQAGDYERAQQDLRVAVQLSVDNEYACSTLVDSCNTLEARIEALTFIQNELLKQPTQGDICLTFQGLALNALSSEALQALLEEGRRQRPELWQTWVALALQLIDTEQLDQALELLQQAEERFPLLPRVHFEKARVLARQGRHEEVRSTVRRALQISPAWSAPIRLYVNSVLAEGSLLESALELLDSPLSRCAESAECLRLRARVLWRLERRDEALQQLEAALRLAPDHEHVWTALAELAGEMGRSGRAAQVAAELAASHPGRHEVWIKLAEYSTDLSEALAALERALALQPRSLAAYTARLERLLQAGRWDEVRALVEHTPWGRHTPTQIRSYGPLLSWRCGQHETAIAAMKRLLADEANDYELWRMLADWYDELDRGPDYIAAAAQMVRINPGNAISHGFAGHAAMKQGQNAEATLHLRRAWRIDPHYTFAGLRLADLLLEQEAWDEARSVIDTLQRHAPSPWVAERRLRLLMGDGQGQALDLPLQHILCSDESCSELVAHVLKILDTRVWSPQLLASLEALSCSGRLCKTAARHWLEHVWSKERRRSFYERIQPCLAADSAGHFFAAFFDFAVAGKRYALAWQLVEAHHSVLRSNGELWGAVSYAAAAAGEYERVVHWMHDWQRDDAPWWALNNLALALSHQRQHQRAVAVARYSMQLEPRHNNSIIWLAAAAAREGRHPDLHSLLATGQQQNFEPFYQKLLGIVAAYAEALQQKRSHPLRAMGERLMPLRRQDRVVRDLFGELRGLWLQGGPQAPAGAALRLWRWLCLQMPA